MAIQTMSFHQIFIHAVFDAPFLDQNNSVVNFYLWKRKPNISPTKILFPAGDLRKILYLRSEACYCHQET